MTNRTLTVLLAAVGVALCALHTPAGQQPGTKVPQELLRTKLDYARKTFEEYWKSQEFKTAETAYQWSCRWLEAQRQLSDKKKDQKEAVEAHLIRMQKLQQAMDQLYQGKLVGLEQVYATAFYVAEAEAWVAQSKD
jgi:hypothetical protein